MRRMQVREHDLHLPSAPIAVLLARMKRSIISHPAPIIAGLFCLGAQLICRAQSEPTNLWVLGLSAIYADASPAVAPDGTIYQASFDGKMRAVTPQGRVKWVFNINTEIKSSPAIADDGTIYWPVAHRRVTAIAVRSDCPTWGPGARHSALSLLSAAGDSRRSRYSAKHLHVD